MENERENFASRLGFILVSAGCAIGIGNVWKFPYLCGAYGGAAFILIYLIFLLILGIPVMTAEFAIGRGSKRSIAECFEKLEPNGTGWHNLKWLGVIGCYMLMFYYTTVAGWMFNYAYRSSKGDFVHQTADFIGGEFGGMLSNAGEMTFWMVLVCVIGFIICFFGVQKGVEAVTKWMMAALLVLMVVLAVHSVFLKGAGEGIEFYLVPNFKAMQKTGIFNVVFAAMSQAFFTLSLGVGSMMIFGSYIDKSRALTGECVRITALDTFVALMAGFIIIPACFAYGIQPDAGPGLIFITIPNLFANMPGGQLWGGLFFVFMVFAALSTVIAVFENLIAMLMDLLGWSRAKSTIFNLVFVTLLSLPCVFGYNIWSFIQLLGEGSTVLDFEDFIVSQNLLPLGSLSYILFITRKNGWGWNNFLKETNEGKGLQFSDGLKPFISYVLPIIIMVVYFKGYYDFFNVDGKRQLLVPWMCASVIFMLFVLVNAFRGSKKQAA